jgi:antitoxin component YwqK of YwqJK toxin-antitoxin module
MRDLSLPLLTCLILLSPNVVLSETMNDLVMRDGIAYKKFSDVPFSGKTTGQEQGTFKNGKLDGVWVSYFNDGTSMKDLSGTYKNGEKISD